MIKYVLLGCFGIAACAPSPTAQKAFTVSLSDLPNRLTKIDPTITIGWEVVPNTATEVQIPVEFIDSASNHFNTSKLKIEIASRTDYSCVIIGNSITIAPKINSESYDLPTVLRQVRTVISEKIEINDALRQIVANDKKFPIMIRGAQIYNPNLAFGKVASEEKESVCLEVLHNYLKQLHGRYWIAYNSYFLDKDGHIIAPLKLGSANIDFIK